MTSRVGSDPALVTYPAEPGAGHAGQLSARPSAAIIGGGIAGLAAATALAERGVAVTLYERESYLGGRVGGWPVTLSDGTPVTMSRGFHAFFRQYYNLRQLLRRTDPELARLAPIPDYPLLDARGHTDTFSGLPRTPPFNALAFVARSPSFGWRETSRVRIRAALRLAMVRVPEVYERLDQIDAASFLREVNFPPSARHLAFEVFSRSFFASPHELSAAELATMFHLYFLGSSEGLLFDVPRDTYPASLWTPLRDHLAQHGAQVRLGTSIRSVQVVGPRRLRVHADDPSEVPAIDVDAVVVATDVAGLRRLLERSPGLGPADWRASVARLRTAPPFLVRRLWLDTPVAAHRPAFLGTGSLAPLDNITVLERYEAQAALWAREHHGTVLELHAYAVTGDPGEVSGQLWQRVNEVYPETAGARIVDQRHEWREDCPLLGVGDFARRPTVITPVPGLTLAGDGIRIDLPVALMERAATTGWHAANQLLADWGLAGHPLHSVPNTGELFGMRGRASATVRRYVPRLRRS